MAQNNQPQNQDLNQLLKVRHDKLRDLQENGKDPFQITKYDVTNHSQEIKDKKTYSVLEIADILQISKSKAYELCKQPDFKVVRLGRTIRISKASFDDWLNNLL